GCRSTTPTPPRPPPGDCCAAARRNLAAVAAHSVIAGVEKAGTTSLFRALSGHPQIAPSSVKETRYFQPILYGQPVAPIAEYESYFAGARTGQLRLEATPRYFYGGASIATRIREALGSEARVIVVLREPIARFESFFDFQKARLRIPADTTVADY